MIGKITNFIEIHRNMKYESSIYPDIRKNKSNSNKYKQNVPNLLEGYAKEIAESSFCPGDLIY